MLLPVPADHPHARELQVAIDACERAAATIMEYYDAHSAETYTKGDGSPVTDADLAADRVIRETVTHAFPDDALMTEEGENDAQRLSNRRVWIIDPIDGTAQFVARTGRFDVLIALAIDGEVTVAATIQPPTGLAHAAVKGAGAWRREGDAWEPLVIATASEPPRLVASRYYLLPEQQDWPAIISQGVGAADLPVMDVGFQPRAFDPSERAYDAFLGFPQDPETFAAREWDIAASDLIVHEAGGVLTDFHGRRHRYNKPHTHIEDGLLVSASPELHERLLEALRPLLSASHRASQGDEM